MRCMISPRPKHLGERERAREGEGERGRAGQSGALVLPLHVIDGDVHAALRPAQRHTVAGDRREHRQEEHDHVVGHGATARGGPADVGGELEPLLRREVGPVLAAERALVAGDVLVQHPRGVLVEAHEAEADEHGRLRRERHKGAVQVVELLDPELVDLDGQLSFERALVGGEHRARTTVNAALVCVMHRVHKRCMPFNYEGAPP